MMIFKTIEQKITKLPRRLKIMIIIGELVAIAFVAYYIAANNLIGNLLP